MICSSLNLLRFILVRLLCVGLYQKSVTFQGSTSVDVAALYSAFAIGLGLYSGRAASYLSAATFTWAVNRRFTFAAKTPPTIIEWLRYVFANTSGGLVNYLTYVALVTWGSGLLSHPALAVACGSIAGLVVNYIASARLVFGESDEKDAQPN
jgi:putative flippase GtrA